VEPLLRTRDDVAAGIRVGWELLHLLQLSVRSLEDTATRVVAAQIAGVIALWTQLHTFEEAVPATLAWGAWGILLVSISLLGFRITPRKLAEFWERLDARTSSPCDDPLEEADEVEIVAALTTALRRQRDRIQFAVRSSVALGIVGLTLAAVAFVVDKGFYSP
jgi:hypothetical protein